MNREGSFADLGDGSSASSVSRHNFVANGLSYFGRAGLTGKVFLVHVPEETTCIVSLSGADDGGQHLVGERKLVGPIVLLVGVSGLSDLVSNEGLKASSLERLHVEVDLFVESTSFRTSRAFMELFVRAHIVSHDIQASSVRASLHEIDDFRELLVGCSPHSLEVSAPPFAGDSTNSSRSSG